MGILINTDNFFNNDVIMASLVTVLNSLTAQVHTADAAQLDFAVGKFVQTRRDCR